MRIIAGTFRSRTLVATPGMSTRPTSDRLRETLFNVLAPQIVGAAFLDLYAGSGAVGIEALIIFAQMLKCRRDAAGIDAESAGNPQLCQISAQRLQRRRRALDKGHPRRAPAERLDSNRARSGKQIQKGSALNPRGEHVEERLPQAVARRPCGQA